MIDPFPKKPSPSCPAANSLPALPINTSLWEAVEKELRLSPQHTRVVEWVLRGLTDDQITEEMGIGYSTLRTYFDRIAIRTGARGRTAILRLVLTVSHRVNL